MKRKFLIILVTILILGTGSFFYVNNILLPTQFKYIAINNLEQFLNRKVTIEKIGYDLLKGFVIHDLVIYQKRSIHKPFVKTKQISINIILPALVQTKRIITPFIKIASPEIYIVRKGKKLWNFSDLLEKAKHQDEERKTPPFILKSIIISEGQVFYSDNTLDPPLEEIFDNTNIKANLSLKKVVSFLANTTISKNNSSISIKGEFLVDDKKLNSKINIDNVLLSRHLSSFYKNNIFRLDSALIKSANIDLAATDKNIALSGDVQIDKSDIRISTNKRFKGQIELNNASLSINGKNIVMEGDISLNKANFKINPDRELSGNLSSKDITLTFIDKVFNLKSSFQLNNARYKFGKNKDFQGTLSGTETFLSVSNKKVTLKGFFQVSNADFKFGKDIALLGSSSADLKLNYDPETKKPLSYSGTLSTDQASFRGLPFIDKASSIKGKFEFETDQIKSNLVEFIALDTAAQLSGQLSNFQRPTVDVELATKETDINKIKHFIPEFIEKHKLVMDGRALFRATYRGHLNKLNSGGLALIIHFNKANIKSKKFDQSLADVSGEIGYDSRVISWRDLQGIFGERNYLLNGKANLFIIPAIATTIKAEGLDALAQIKLLPDSVQISSLEGSYRDMKFDINGDVRLKEKQSPDLNLNGNIELELDSIANVFPSLKDKLKNLNPKGTVKLIGSLKGAYDDWRNWELKFSSQAPKVTLSGYTLDDVSLQYEQKDQSINQCDLLAGAYGGKLNVLSSALLSEEDIPSQLSFTLESANLAKLKKDTSFKSSELSGTMDLSFGLNGPLLNTDKISGQGKLGIAKGYLWKTNLLPGLLKNLLIQKYRNVVFTDASADFTIFERRIETNNFMLTSEAVDLLGQGWIDFDTNIEVSISPEFKKIALVKSNLFGDTNLLAQADNLFVIKFTGTLNKPNYSFQTGPERIIEKTTNFLIDGIQNIFEGIF